MPMMLADLALVLEQSALAAWVNSSRYLLGFLSGLHLVGFTLTVGSALVSSRHALRRDRASRRAFASSSARVMGVGLGLSLVTGGLMVVPRATAALENRIFVLKMALLAAAIVVHGVTMRLSIVDGPLPPMRRVGTIVATVLWVGVGVAGCAFILLE